MVMIGGFNAIGIYYERVLGGWSIECAKGGYLAYQSAATSSLYELHWETTTQAPQCALRFSSHHIFPL